MKFIIAVLPLDNILSLPAWGAWIEILMIKRKGNTDGMSLPAWGAWIEIVTLDESAVSVAVAPRMGGVD